MVSGSLCRLNQACAFYLESDTGSHDMHHVSNAGDLFILLGESKGGFALSMDTEGKVGWIFADYLEEV